MKREEIKVGDTIWALGSMHSAPNVYIIGFRVVRISDYYLEGQRYRKGKSKFGKIYDSCTTVKLQFTECWPSPEALIEGFRHRIIDMSSPDKIEQLT